MYMYDTKRFTNVLDFPYNMQTGVTREICYECAIVHSGNVYLIQM